MHSLLPANYTRSIYAEGYIVFVFPFVSSSVHSSVHSYFPIRQSFGESFSSVVHLSNHLSENIHIKTIVTLDGWHSHHDFRPQAASGWG